MQNFSNIICMYITVHIVINPKYKTFNLSFSVKGEVLQSYKNKSCFLDISNVKITAVAHRFFLGMRNSYSLFTRNTKCCIFMKERLRVFLLTFC